MEAEKSNAAKEFLLQAKKCETEIHNILAKKARLESLREKTTTTWGTERVSGSGNNDNLCDTTAKIMELEKEYDEAISALKEKEREIDSVLGKVENPKYHEVLSRVYIQYETLEQVACDLNIGYRHITRIHGNALKVIGSILSEEVLKSPCMSES